MADAAGVFADPQLAAYVAGLRENPGPSNAELGAAGLRAASQQRSAARPRGPELAAVSTFAIGPHLRARLYRPVLEPRPLVVFLHGGGWTVGDLDSHDRICRRLARTSGCAVLAIDYRRAPEHPWPAAVDDAVAAIRWARANTVLGWTSDIGVAGDSSGGNLSALACIRLRADGEKLPVLQALAYPNTDLTFSQPSALAKATGWGLDLDGARWFAEQFAPDEELRRSPLASPLFEPELVGLPTALVVTAEHDILRDEGNLYASRLSSAGVLVEHRCEAGLIHGFLGLDVVSPAAAAAGDRFFADVGALLRGGPSEPAA